jgi:hypothetical protein
VLGQRQMIAGQDARLLAAGDLAATAPRVGRVDEAAAVVDHGAERQRVHPTQRIELGRPGHEALLAVGARPPEHVEPLALAHIDEVGADELGTQPHGFGDRRRPHGQQLLDDLVAHLRLPHLHVRRHPASPLARAADLAVPDD